MAKSKPPPLSFYKNLLKALFRKQKMKVFTNPLLNLCISVKIEVANLP